MIKLRIPITLSLFFLLTLLLPVAGSIHRWRALTGFPAAPGSLNSRETETEWWRVSPEGEEFSIMTPVTPTLFKGKRNYFMSEGRVEVLHSRFYGGYADNFAFYIESHKTEQPKSVLKVFGAHRYPLRVFESKIKLNGYDAKEYRLTHEHYYGKYFEVITERHVYLITIASRGASNTSVARFVSALMLGDNITQPAAGQVLDVKDSPFYQSAILSESGTVQSPVTAYKSSEVTRKAVIVGRPEPVYTDEARRKPVKGTVILRGIFGADGQVRDLRVMQGLEADLTSRAIEAALSIRFFPAEKDGQPVSQYIQIEYNF